jgi:hypothetical protein
LLKTCQKLFPFVQIIFLFDNQSFDTGTGVAEEEEVGGLWGWDIAEMGEVAGFKLRLPKRFLYRMNNPCLFRV